MANDGNGPQPGESRLETFLLDTAGRPHRTRRWLPRLLLALALLVLVFGAWWSREPAPPDVAVIVQAAGTVPGAASTTTLVATLRVLLDKPGGFIANDALPPGDLLDNMPAFENGALEEARTFLRALRRDFSRSEAQAVEDPDLLRAEPRLQFDSGSWLVPSAEGEYEDGIAALDSYRARLLAPDTPGAHFYPRIDSLARWLDDIGADLDDYGGQLVAAASPASSWFDIDDHFFAARGYCWALRAQLQAMRHDYEPLFAAQPDADRDLATALDALGGTQLRVTSPVILNGSEYGLLANHSLVMAGHVGRAASALRSLRTRLAALPH